MIPNPGPLQEEPGGGQGVLGRAPTHGQAPSPSLGDFKWGFCLSTTALVLFLYLYFIFGMCAFTMFVSLQVHVCMLHGGQRVALSVPSAVFFIEHRLVPSAGDAPCTPSPRLQVGTHPHLSGFLWGVGS